MCSYHCAQLSYTIQHRTVPIIFLHILQTVIISPMLSIGGKAIMQDGINVMCVSCVWLNCQSLVVVY